jgi:hypothetical protein
VRLSFSSLLLRVRLARPSSMSPPKPESTLPTGMGVSGTVASGEPCCGVGRPWYWNASKGGGKMDGSRGSYVVFGLVMVLCTRLSAGPRSKTNNRRRTYNTSDGVRINAALREPIRGHAHEMVVGLLLCAKVCIVHGGSEVAADKVCDRVRCCWFGLPLSSSSIANLRTVTKRGTLIL